MKIKASRMNKDQAKVAKREKLFSTLAKQEAKGANERVRTETGAAKKDSQREAKIDILFAKKRAKWAKEAKGKE
jgi:hypothetical protein